jgi:hypothetical protein
MYHIYITISDERLYLNVQVQIYSFVKNVIQLYHMILILLNISTPLLGDSLLAVTDEPEIIEQGRPCG